MFRDLDKYLTYASILGIIIPTALIFLLKNPKHVSFIRNSLILLLSMILILSIMFFVHLLYVGSFTLT